MNAKNMQFIPSDHIKESAGFRIFFIRHAESTANIIPRNSPIDISTLSTDPSLSPLGYTQAMQLSSFIKNHEHLSKISEIYCSPMYRSLLTTRYLQESLRINPEIWVDLHEVKGCRVLNTPYPGHKRSEIETEFPGFLIPDECTENGWFLKDSIESEEEAWNRAGRVWDRLMYMSQDDRNQGKSVAIVAHGLFLDYLLGRMCGREMKGQPRFIFYNAGISFVWIKNGMPYIYFLDRIDHLTTLPLNESDV